MSSQTKGFLMGVVVGVAAYHFYTNAKHGGM